MSKRIAVYFYVAFDVDDGLLEEEYVSHGVDELRRILADRETTELELGVDDWIILEDNPDDSINEAALWEWTHGAGDSQPLS